jgi:hypothetical protein
MSLQDIVFIMLGKYKIGVYYHHIEQVNEWMDGWVGEEMDG